MTLVNFCHFFVAYQKTLSKARVQFLYQFFGRSENFHFKFLSQCFSGKKPIPDFLKPFEVFKSDWENLSCYFFNISSRKGIWKENFQCLLNCGFSECFVDIFNKVIIIIQRLGQTQRCETRDNDNYKLKFRMYFLTWES